MPSISAKASAASDGPLTDAALCPACCAAAEPLEPGFDVAEARPDEPVELMALVLADAELPTAG